MTADLEQTRAFLAALAPGERVTLQTFNDGPDDRPGLARILHGTLERRAGTLTGLNSHGAGIYVMVNEGDRKGRKEKNVTRVRAVFADFDGVPLPEHWELKPHILVLSSPGRHHVYWLVSDLPLEEFSAVQKALAAHYGSDDKVSDLPRVMRLPGFHHCKREPVMVRLLEASEHPAYTRADLLTAWPAVAHALAPVAPQEPQPSNYTPPTQSDHGDHARRYALSALQKEHDNVAAARDGQRNDTLNRAAFALGQLVGAGALDRHEVEDALRAAAATCGLPVGEVTPTLKSGVEAGMKEPREIPEVKRGKRATGKTNEKKEAEEEEPPSDLLTEYGNAWRIHRALQAEIAYSPGLGWLLYSSERGVWEVEPGTERLRRVVTEALRAALEAEKRELLAELDDVNGKIKAERDTAALEALNELLRYLEGKLKKLTAWILSCENHNRIANTLKAAEGVFWVPASVWDADPDILVCVNGVLNLTTGELAPHAPTYRATKRAGAAYLPGAAHPAFTKVLDLLAQEGDRLESIRRGAGALLHSGNPNERLWILQGDAGTSKGTLITSVASAMGDYAQALDVTALLEGDRRQGKAAPRPDLLKLRGARFVYSAQEPPKYAKIDAGTVKGLTGNDAVTVRGLYERAEVTFYPQFKIWIHSNFPLRVDWDDPGFARRLVIWPFNAKPEVPDVTIKTSLLNDPTARAAVLAWLVEQHKAWLEDGFGLGESKAVDDAIKKYWEQINPFTDFADECLAFGLDFSTPKSAVKARYKTWCDKQKWRPLSDRELSKWLAGKDGVESGKTGKGHFWRGVRVILPDEETAEIRARGDVSDVSDVSTERPLKEKEKEKYIEDFKENKSLTSLTSPKKPNDYTAADWDEI
jgi:P4 family phage/plasmid primase-like protien